MNNWQKTNDLKKERKKERKKEKTGIILTSLRKFLNFMLTDFIIAILVLSDEIIVQLIVQIAINLYDTIDIIMPRGHRTTVHTSSYVGGTKGLNNYLFRI